MSTIKTKNKETHRSTPLLSQRAFTLLRKQILDGEFKEGERLNEATLQKLLGTSRSPIREAFRQLRTEGLVEIIPRRGTFVRRISSDDLKEATEVRAALEKLAAQLSCKHISRNSLSQLKRLVDEMDEKTEAGDIEAYTSLNHRFHKLIVETSGNQILMRMHTIVTDPFVNNHLTYIHMKRLGNSKENEHREIYNLLKSGKVTKACNLIERHAKSILKAFK